MRFFIVCLALNLISVIGFSQDSDQPVTELDFDKIHFYLTGEVAIPSAELGKAVNNDWGNLGFGLTTGVLFNPFGKHQASPVLLGADFNYIIYGVDKIAQTQYSPALKTSFNVYSVHGSGRLLLNQKIGFAPFVDGLIGVKIFNTRTKVDKDLSNIILGTNYPEVIATTNDTSLDYGLGLGFFKRKERGQSPQRASFTVRILYSWGANARYVVRNSVKFDANNNLTYQTGSTRTDMVQIQIGLMLY